MKKLIVLLLAFAMVGAVSAQVTTAVSLSGQVDLVKQDGQGQFVQWGSGYDLLTFKATEKDGKYGISATIDGFLDKSLLDGLNATPTFRDWNFMAKGKMTKVFVGKLRNADFRTTLPYWPSYDVFGGTDRITDWGLLVETLPMNGLTLGVNLPYGLTAANTVDVLQNADLGAKYAVKDVGTFTALVNLDLVAPAANVVNLGFTFTGVKSLTAVAIGQLKLDANTYKAAVGVAYTGVDKLTVNVEGGYVSTAGVGTYSVWGQGTYDLTDAFSATAGAFYGSAGYDVYANVDYAYGNGLTSEALVGFDSALHAALTLYYTVSL